MFLPKGKHPAFLMILHCERENTRIFRYNLWSKVQELHPDIKFQIVPFENTPENAREILANLGKNMRGAERTVLCFSGCCP